MVQVARNDTVTCIVTLYNHCEPKKHLSMPKTLNFEMDGLQQLITLFSAKIKNHPSCSVED